jgi:hypothetical protein
MIVNVRFEKNEEYKEFEVEIGENEHVENTNTIPIKLYSEITQDQLDSVVGKANKMLEGTDWDSPDAYFVNYWL